MTIAESMQHVPLDDLEYDFGNPRIAHLLEIYGSEVTAAAIYLALKPGDSKFLSLKEAIKTYGGIINPIKVNVTDGNMTVFEGNTRLAIYREFDDAGDPGNWSEIPCMIYKNLSEEEVDRLRLQDHLVGTREWSPYAKAKYLHHLSTVQEMPMEDLVSFCGGNKPQTVRMIDAYKDMETHYRAFVRDDADLDEDDDYDLRKYSAFEEFQRPNARMAVSRAGYSEKDFAGWVAHGKFNRLEHVRQLPKILKHPQAKREFLRNGSDAALRFVQIDPADLLRKVTVPHLCRALSQALTSEIKLSEVQDIKDDQEELDAVQDAFHDLQNFVEHQLLG